MVGIDKVANVERIRAREVARIACAGRILLYAVDIDLNLVGV